MSQPPSNPDLARLLEYLTSRPGWTPAKTISRHTISDNHPSGWSARYVSQLAEESDGLILGTTDGYKAAAAATDNDILDAYYQCIRRAMATDLRARRIIHRARMAGRLSHKTDEQIAAEARERAITAQTQTGAKDFREFTHTRTSPPTYEQESLF